MSRRNRTLIEFTETVQSGDTLREKGDRLYVDPTSLQSFVKIKKVAKEVKETTKTAPAAPATSPAPETGDQ